MAACLPTETEISSDPNAVIQYTGLPLPFVNILRAYLTRFSMLYTDAVLWKMTASPGWETSLCWIIEATLYIAVLCTANTGVTQHGQWVVILCCVKPNTHRRLDATRIRCWKICSDLLRLSPTSCEFRTHRRQLQLSRVGGVYWACDYLMAFQGK